MARTSGANNMGKSKPNTCPGCSRHCSLDHVRCKYGQKYLEKMKKAQADNHSAQKAAETHRYKWEKHVKAAGSAWKLLYCGSRLKRALRKKTLTEEQLFSVLSDEERTQLDALLSKLLQRIP